MTSYADPERIPDVIMLLQPSVSWPNEMIVGRRHLVMVDLALVDESRLPASWPLADEECAYTCALDGGGDFDLWAVHDAAVVLHRFGGSYGPAEFVVTPQNIGERSLRLTIINQWGVPVGDHELRVHVSPAERLQKDLPPDHHDADPAWQSPTPPAQLDLPSLARRDLVFPATAYSETADLFADTRSVAATTPQSRPPVPSGRPANRLAEEWNVAGLRRSPSGNLHFNLVPLFAPGAVPGDRFTFTVRCPPADEHGTVFAVVGRLPGDAERLTLRSVQSAPIPPGTYQVTAELVSVQPGRVRFHGLPVSPRDDPRNWQEIVSAVPHRLRPRVGPNHLITAIEVSGPGDLVAARINAMRQFVAYVAEADFGPLSCTVITYGPHSVNARYEGYPEVPVTTLARADTAAAALSALATLAQRPAAPFGYTAAAQLECVLAELNIQLTGQEGRPVLVVAGGRPPHPWRVEPVSRILPCSRRNDWRIHLGNLVSRHVGMTFGAVHDPDLPDELWLRLGRDAGTAIQHFSAPRFADVLGLTAGDNQLIPLPLIGVTDQDVSPATLR